MSIKPYSQIQLDLQIKWVMLFHHFGITSLFCLNFFFLIFFVQSVRQITCQVTIRYVITRNFIVAFLVNILWGKLTLYPDRITYWDLNENGYLFAENIFKWIFWNGRKFLVSFKLHHFFFLWVQLIISQNKLPLVRVMAWHRTCSMLSHYLNQYSTSSMMPYGITRPHWVKNCCSAWVACIVRSLFWKTSTIAKYHCSISLVWHLSIYRHIL